jgi:hypothetical protein
VTSHRIARNDHQDYLQDMSISPSETLTLDGQGVSLRRWPVFLMGLAALALLVGGTGLLWAKTGSAVFFETLLNGLGACF